MTNVTNNGPGQTAKSDVEPFDEAAYRAQLIEMGTEPAQAAQIAVRTAEARRESAATNQAAKRAVDPKRVRVDGLRPLSSLLGGGLLPGIEPASAPASRAAAPSPGARTPDDYRAARRKVIEAQARPGETYQQAEQRYLLGNNPSADTASGNTLRKPPEGDAQADFFVPLLYDVATKDSRSIMDVAVFRLSKKDKRANETIRYMRPDGYVEVVSGDAGMASVWDYDIVLMAISHLTDAMNRYREGRGEKPSRTFRPHVSEILKFCRRSDGGRQYEEIEGALKRLSTTFVEVVTTTQAKGKRALRTAQGVGLINSYKTVSYADNGRITSVEIEVPQWLYNEVVEVKSPAVLTVHPEYFLIEPGIGRFLYRLARRAAGKTRAKWSFQTIYERSGSTGDFKKFTFNLRGLIKANGLPEYLLAEVPGKSGPQLMITHRDASDDLPEPQEDDGGEDDNAPPA